MEIKKILLALGIYTVSFSALSAAFIISSMSNLKKDTKNDKLAEDVEYMKRLLHKIYFCEKINLKNSTGINIDEFYEKYQSKLSEKILEDINLVNDNDEGEEENE